MTEQQIRDAYIRIRKIDQTIPDDVLDFMLAASLEKLKQIEAKRKQDELSKLYIVRFYDGFDNEWMDITEPVSYEEAKTIYDKETENGTVKANYGDIDYYRIFAADTKMRYSGE